MDGRTENVFDLIRVVQRMEKGSTGGVQGSKGGVGGRARTEIVRVRGLENRQGTTGTSSCEGHDIPNVVETQLHCS